MAVTTLERQDGCRRIDERYARFSLKEWIDRPPGGNLQ
jgi:hypothetical protein